jgi:hypothetical protein
MSITIAIRYSENPRLKCVRALPSPAIADAVFKHAAHFAPLNGSYDKTWVTLTLENGHRLAFRVDLVHPSCEPFRGILQEALDFLDFVEEEEEGELAITRTALILRGHVVAALPGGEAPPRASAGRPNKSATRSAVAHA